MREDAQALTRAVIWAAAMLITGAWLGLCVRVFLLVAGLGD